VNTLVWSCDDLPFHLGATPTPDNPPGFPNTLPFVLEVSPETGLVVQRRDEHVLELLGAAYANGSIIGVAMDDTAIGRAYATDFLGFVDAARGRRPWPEIRALEIGAGRGYFLSLLARTGCTAIGLEPGRENLPYWRRFGVEVVADSFPSAQVPGRFDLVVAYGVLEHVADATAFLAAVARQVADDGRVVFAVPNCRPYIDDCDPSMLVHEHWSYFTAETLSALLMRSGFTVLDAAPSGYGGALYVAAAPGPATARVEAPPPTLQIGAFAPKVEALRRRMADGIARCRAGGRSLGIFCPSRGLAVLPVDRTIRFFDDNPDIQGMYYPPFASVIESRAALIAAPTDELWILSRTFGDRLAAELAGCPELRATRILTLAALTAGLPA